MYVDEKGIEVAMVMCDAYTVVSTSPEAKKVNYHCTGSCVRMILIYRH